MAAFPICHKLPLNEAANVMGCLSNCRWAPKGFQNGLGQERGEKRRRGEAEGGVERRVEIMLKGSELIRVLMRSRSNVDLMSHTQKNGVSTRQ